MVKPLSDTMETIQVVCHGFMQDYGSLMTLDPEELLSGERDALVGVFLQRIGGICNDYEATRPRVAVPQENEARIRVGQRDNSPAISGDRGFEYVRYALRSDDGAAAAAEDLSEDVR